MCIVSIHERGGVNVQLVRMCASLYCVLVCYMVMHRYVSLCIVVQCNLLLDLDTTVVYPKCSFKAFTPGKLLSVNCFYLFCLLHSVEVDV